MPRVAGALLAFWGRRADFVSIGAILAFLVLVAAFVLFLMNRMDGMLAGLFGALALSILLSPFPVRWPGQA